MSEQDFLTEKEFNRAWRLKGVLDIYLTLDEVEKAETLHPRINWDIVHKHFALGLDKKTFWDCVHAKHDGLVYPSRAITDAYWTNVKGKLLKEMGELLKQITSGDVDKS